MKDILFSSNKILDFSFKLKYCQFNLNYKCHFQVLPQIAPTLIAVSKIRPASAVLEAYQGGHRDFGENYVNELFQKSNDPLILENCKDIRWHFIGHLQTNKINKVLSVPRLYMIQTVHSQKLANNLNKQWVKYRKEENEKLAVMVQINTSGEEGRYYCLWYVIEVLDL